uniref:Putative ovule protein n=1 Tax=Solanum chacoense TaxID=4108 RepID=A0A0V0H754_SOLCH
MEFDEYCSSHWIIHEKTVPETPPQHDGVTKRMNCLMVEKVTKHAQNGSSAKSFSDEAVQTSENLLLDQQKSINFTWLRYPGESLDE